MRGHLSGSKGRREAEEGSGELKPGMQVKRTPK